MPAGLIKGRPGPNTPASSGTAPDWDAYGQDRLLERNRLMFEHHQATVRVFTEYFATVDMDSRVLDCGCGGGFFLEILRNLGFDRIEGIDLSEPFVARAKKKNLQVTKASIFDLSDQSQFDHILCMELFEHLEQPPYAELRSALRDDGCLYVSVPVYDSFQHRWERLRGGVSKLQQAQLHDPTHIRGYSKEILLDELKQAGFRPLFARHCYNRMPYVPLRTAWRICERFFDTGMFLVVVAVKDPR